MKFCPQILKLETYPNLPIYGIKPIIILIYKTNPTAAGNDLDNFSGYELNQKTEI